MSISNSNTSIVGLPCTTFDMYQTHTKSQSITLSATVFDKGTISLEIQSSAAVESYRNHSMYL